MKLTENDVRFFEQLSKTETGRYFADYVKRVIDYVHDSRSWSENDSRESSAQASRLVQELILDKIRPATKGNKVGETYE